MGWCHHGAACHGGGFPFGWSSSMGFCSTKNQHDQTRPGEWFQEPRGLACSLLAYDIKFLRLYHVNLPTVSPKTLEVLKTNYSTSNPIESPQQSFGGWSTFDRITKGHRVSLETRVTTEWLPRPSKRCLLKFFLFFHNVRHHQKTPQPDGAAF